MRMGAWIARVLLVSLAVLALPKNDESVRHVVDRMSFGPRPGDVERVKSLGVEQYIDEQLHPERLADPGIDGRLADLQTLRMSSRQIADEFEIPQLKARQAAEKNGASGNADAKPNPELQQRANSVVVELQEQKVLRAIYSTRQLQEVLVDFWFNHFNVDSRKGADRFLLTEYERDVIRPHVFGKFRDLLRATAKSPAMLFYLDNWMSVDPNGPHIEVPPARVVRGPFGAPVIVQPPARIPKQNPNAPKGLNENYGRELMELHTLGVDGGYTQQDVTEVARAFTGWTIDQPRQGGGFMFDPRRHDEGRKIVLGHVIKPGGGEHDGEDVLDLLARHPSTAHFIATKLVRRFVSDTPPPTLVDRVAARFRETDGDLREVMRAILTSPEFFSSDAYHAKVKTPFEFVVSAVRATDAEVHDARPLVRQITELGEPLYQCQPPTGYKDTADAWVNTGALVGRMNFGLALAGNKLRGVVVSNAQPDGVELGKPEFQRR
ncbi:MAG TPA: DUF1800 domain-containing protein [Vicinamibacterales bacterium]|nr:DUF1800 domain-containing protein [Vicinamibacterales bacterium]